MCVCVCFFLPSRGLITTYNLSQSVLLPRNVQPVALALAGAILYIHLVNKTSKQNQNVIDIDHNVSTLHTADSVYVERPGCIYTSARRCRRRMTPPAASPDRAACGVGVGPGETPPRLDWRVFMDWRPTMTAWRPSHLPQGSRRRAVIGRAP